MGHVDIKRSKLTRWGYVLFLFLALFLAGAALFNLFCLRSLPLRFFFPAVRTYWKRSLLLFGVLLLTALYWLFSLCRPDDRPFTVSLGGRSLRLFRCSFLRSPRPAPLLVAAAVCLLSLLSFPFGGAGRPGPWPGDVSIAHALGEIGGSTYTNSREAFETNYAQGFRTFELDIVTALNGEAICAHNDEGTIPDGDYFLLHPIWGGGGDYTPMRFSDLCLLMKRYPDVWIVTDTKYTQPEQIRPEFQAMVDAACSVGALDVLDRLVVQIYHEDMYALTQEIYPFSSYIFTLYQRWDETEAEFAQLCAWCRENSLPNVAIWHYLDSDAIRETARANGLDLYIYVVNDLTKAKDRLEKGVRGIYTDQLSPRQLLD